MSKRKNYIEEALILAAKRYLPPDSRKLRAIDWSKASTKTLWQVLAIIIEVVPKHAGLLKRRALKYRALQTEEQLRDGNWSAAAAYLREGGDVSDEIRSLLADILEGKRRYPNRPPSVQTLRLHNKVAAFVVEGVRSGMSAARAYRVASERFGLVPESIEDICKKRASTHAELARISELYRLEFDAFSDMAKRIVEELESRGVTRRPRFFPAKGGLTEHFLP